MILVVEGSTCGNDAALPKKSDVELGYSQYRER